MRQVIGQPETYRDTLRYAACAFYDGHLDVYETGVHFAKDSDTFVVRVLKKSGNTPKVSIAPDRLDVVTKVIVVILDESGSEVVDSYMIPRNVIRERGKDYGDKIELSLSRAMVDYSRPPLTRWLRTFR
jgi:hypothetical protein